LINGGGIFPDVEIAPDSLKTVERELLEQSATLNIPINVRIAEFGFQESQRARQAGAAVALDPAAFATFIERLKGEGVPSALLDHPEVRSYLSWRSRDIMASRLQDEGALALVRMERDPALTEAVRLLGASRTQDDLFAAARRVNSTGAAQPKP
jgi:hypothetical protein